jgi:hypothetical protein
MAGKKGRSGGPRKGKNGRKKGDPDNNGRGGKTPDQFMKALIPVGPRTDHDQAEAVEGEYIDADFTPKKATYIDPVDFCQAVVNGDLEVLKACGVVQIPDLDQKLLASKIAVPYTNKKKPVDHTHKHELSWTDQINEAENRLRTKRMDLENGPEGTIN